MSIRASLLLLRMKACSALGGKPEEEHEELEEQQKIQQDLSDVDEDGADDMVEGKEKRSAHHLTAALRGLRPLRWPVGPRLSLKIKVALRNLSLILFCLSYMHTQQMQVSRICIAS